jgi:hypothetical protein
VQASPSSSDSGWKTGPPRWAGVGLIMTLLLLGGTGCVTVRPEDKEILADPSMSFDDGADVHGHEEHVFSNREGSFGGGGVSGGGCGCN